MPVIITTKPRPTLTLELSPDLAEALLRRQREDGDTGALEAELLHSVRRAVIGTAGDERSNRTLREICAPLEEDFQRSGMTQKEWGDLVDRAVEDARAQTQRL